MNLETQRRHRINVALWAFAYEIMNDPLVSDAKYDEVAGLIDVNLDTGHEVLDKFFKEYYSKHTGMWVRQHPELNKLEALYRRIKNYHA